MIRRPWGLIPAGLAHKVSPFFLNIAYPFLEDRHPEWDKFTWRKLNFCNRVGIAGGVDKNAKNLKAWEHMGYGFLEVGTVTPLPQLPNPGKTIARNWSQEALWNKLGFPNDGCEKIQKRLESYMPHRKRPLFLNIGKNRQTPFEKAAGDYVLLIQNLHHLADAFIINISSPNTQDLRALLKPKNLEFFLKPIAESASVHGSQLLLKLSPDMDTAEVENLISVSLDFDFSGWILSNSTAKGSPPLDFPEGGGITGRPLTLPSRTLLQDFMRSVGSRKKDRLVVSVGGILDYEEFKIRRDLGADLIQVYSALVFRGPHFVKILRHRHRAGVLQV